MTQVTINSEEKDWQLFKAKLPLWIESHLDKTIEDYQQLLSKDMKSTDKFWELEKRINEDKKKIVFPHRMSRSKLRHNISSLLMDEVITFEDLNDFSHEFINLISTEVTKSKLEQSQK